jgi:hypothetical protein
MGSRAISIPDNEVKVDRQSIPDSEVQVSSSVPPVKPVTGPLATDISKWSVSPRSAEEAKGTPLGDVMQGWKDIGEGNLARGAHGMVTGTFGAMKPAIMMGALTNPVSTGAALAGGYSGGAIGRVGGRALGLNEDQSSLAGDVGALLGGSVGGAGAEGISRFRGAIPRIARGPTGTEPITFKPMEWLAREAEHRIPMNEPAGARNEMYNEKAEALMRRGKEQAALDRPMQRFMGGKPGPFNLVSSSPNIPTPGEIPPFPGEETGATPAGGGIRPSPSERNVTNVVRKRIVTPEEAALESRELAGAAKRPGEGLMDREARLLGMARARRAAKTMKEPQ